MTDQMTSTKVENIKKADGARFRPTILRITLILLGIPVACFILMFLLEIPCRQTLPIVPPNRSKSWENTTYSVQIWPPNFPIAYSKYFIWREEADVYSGGPHGTVSLESLVNYFDNEFVRLGWVRYDKSDYCNLYLPEAKFLDREKGGYLAFRKKDTKEYYGFTEGTTACLAIWVYSRYDDGSPYSFRVVMMTARPSPLTLLGAALQLH
jgi:hypothetical protein